MKSVCWRGRAVRVHLLTKLTEIMSCHNVSFIFVHMAHGDEQSSALADVAFLIRTRPRGSKVTIFGDINVDQLPTLGTDPFHMLPHRSSHHRLERMRLHHFCDQFSLDVAVPDVVSGCPGGPFAEQCILAPISRVPVGLLANTCVPSLIDYALTQPGILKVLTLSWIDVPADHAWLFAEVDGKVINKRSSRKSDWKCIDDRACSEWMRANCPRKFANVQQFHTFVVDAQELYCDRRSCHLRSNEREPASVKLLRRELSITYDERARMQLQKSIWQIRKEFLADMARQRDHDKVKKGGVLYKSKKLFPICSMQLTVAAGKEAGCSSQDTDLQMLEVKHEYQVKWGCHNLQLRSSVSDALNRFDGLGINISSSDVVCARFAIKKFGKVDHYGVSPRGIWMLASVCSDVVCSFLTRVMSSRQLMESISINGLLFAKARGAILASKTRAILPLPAILTWLDCILFKRLHPFVDSLFPEVESVFIGARPFTQTLDIMHGLQSVIEKGLDAHGQSAIAQMDIRRYYDSIHVLRVFRYLVDRHCDEASAICLLRFHCCPCVLLQFNSVSVPIQSRSIGALTGTRTAGLSGRIPVEDVIQKRHHIWEQFCFKTDSSSLALATYIDNIFSTGSCAEGAVEILKDCELHLQILWVAASELIPKVSFVIKVVASPMTKPRHGHMNMATPSKHWATSWPIMVVSSRA